MLHPQRDGAGVHRFDLKEIDRVAATIRASKGGWLRQSRWLADDQDRRKPGHRTASDDDCDGECRKAAGSLGGAQSLIERVMVLEGELQERDRLEATRTAQARRDNCELVATVIGLFGALSDRELRRLGDDYLDSVLSLLDKMCADQ